MRMSFLARRANQMLAWEEKLYNSLLSVFWSGEAVAPPLQLFREDVVVVDLRQERNRHRIIRRFHRNRAPRRQAGDRHAIHLDLGGTRRFIKLHFYRFGGVDHHRPVGERLRANWRHGEHVTLGADDRTAGGERVSSGTGGRGDNKTVAPITGEPTLSNAGSDADHVRVGAACDDGVVQRPSCHSLLSDAEFQIECGALTDDKLGIEHALHFLPDAISANGSDEPQIADVDPKNRQAGTAKPVGGLKQCSVPADGDDQIDLAIAKVRQLSEEVLSRRQGFNPFLPNPLAVEKSLQRTGRLPRVRFDSIDDDNHLADFHVALRVSEGHVESLNRVSTQRSASRCRSSCEPRRSMDGALSLADGVSNQNQCLCWRTTVPGVGAVVGFKSTPQRLAESPRRFTPSFTGRSFKILLDMVCMLHYLCIV